MTTSSAPEYNLYVSLHSRSDLPLIAGDAQNRRGLVGIGLDEGIENVFGYPRKAEVDYRPSGPTIPHVATYCVVRE